MTNFDDDYTYEYGSCDCCLTFFDEGELLFSVGKKNYCQKCIHKADEYEQQILMIASDGAMRRVVDETTIKSLPNSIYTLQDVNGHLTVDEEIPDEKKNCIHDYVEKDRAVLEKNMWGAVIRLPKSMIVKKYTFNPDEKSYSELYEMINAVKPTKTFFLCDGDDVVAMACLLRSPRAINEFACYERKYQSVAKEDFKKLRLNPPISTQIHNALQGISPSVMLEYFEERLIGQESETRKIVYTFFEYLRCVASGKSFTAPNWILTAPSGCGKTEVYRILNNFCKEYAIPVPIVQVDLSLFTEAGYKGKEVTEIIRQIVEANNTTDGTAICFLDEADKKFVPSISSGTNFNAAFQANLLTMIEGSMQTVEAGSDKKDFTIDTSKTMFVLMGAFQEIREKKQQKLEKTSSIGFGSCIEKKERPNHVDDCFYENISIEDMLEVGMLQELAGRVEQVINLHKLSEENMEYLLAEKARHISNELGIQVELTPCARKSLLEISYSSLGIRRPINSIRTLAKEALTEAYFDDDFDKNRWRIIIHSTKEADLLPIDNNDFYEAFA